MSTNDGLRLASTSGGESSHTGGVTTPRPQRQRTPAELVAERFRAIDEFVQKYGMDYWETHTEPPTADTTVQLPLERAA